jgi:SAM-dependent methyltransferase
MDEDELDVADEFAGGVTRRIVTAPENLRASRTWWDADADAYQSAHGAFLGEVELRWCPEGLREEDARLLGDVAGRRIVEVGCGAAAGARWLVTQGAHVVALDVSAGMLRHARIAAAHSGVPVPLLQADATFLPFPDAGLDSGFDVAFTAFGAVPFVDDSAAVMREVFRILRPGGLWVFAVTHPMRWIFLDDPGERGLVAVHSYFDRRPYVEEDESGTPTYVEHHRTLGDRVRELVDAGFVLTDIVEPEWPDSNHEVWGQWSPLRGRIFPGTAIFCATKPAYRAPSK